MDHSNLSPLAKPSDSSTPLHLPPIEIQRLDGGAQPNHTVTMRVSLRIKRVSFAATADRMLYDH